MSHDNALLDALTQRGVLISVSIRYWRASKKLRPEDLGLDPEQIDDRLISLGHKKLIPKEALKSLALVEGRAHALVEANSFPFLGGVAHYLPNTKLDDVTSKLQDLKTEFEHHQAEFLRQYDNLHDSALRQWRSVAEGLVDDPERLVVVISEAFPTIDRLERRFSFDVRLFQLALPEATPHAQLVDLGTQQQVIRARREAAELAKRQIDQSCREFIEDCVATLRQQTAQLCTEMLATINGTDSVHQKTLNRLVTFIDRFRELNFTDDQEMAAQLEHVREQFLQRDAGTYRDSSRARTELVAGLTRLRDKASELAQQNKRELVESFGQMGRRKFNLAA